MSHYLLTKLRLAKDGSITEVAVRKLGPDPQGLSALGIGPEQQTTSAVLAGWIEAGDSVYIGERNDSSGAFEIGDEVRTSRRRDGLESCNVDGARTKALLSLPRLS
jgi:hypothetical protein